MIDGMIVNTLALQIVSYIALGISGCMLLYSSIGLMRYFAIAKNEKDKVLIRWNKLYSIIGLTCMLVFLLGMIMAIFDPFKISSKESTYEENLLAGIFMSTFIVLGFVICLFGLNCQIEVNEDNFVHTNFIGIKHTYSYEEIEIRTLRAAYRGYKDGKYKFTISFLQENSDALCLAKERYDMSKKSEHKKKIVD